MKGRNFRIMLEQAGKSCEWLGGAEVLCKRFETNEKTVETIEECEKCQKNSKKMLGLETGRGKSKRQLRVRNDCNQIY
jgi:hypothetical protein